MRDGPVEEGPDVVALPLNLDHPLLLSLALSRRLVPTQLLLACAPVSRRRPRDVAVHEGAPKPSEPAFERRRGGARVEVAARPRAGDGRVEGCEEEQEREEVEEVHRLRSWEGRGNCVVKEREGRSERAKGGGGEGRGCTGR